MGLGCIIWLAFGVFCQYGFVLGIIPCGPFLFYVNLLDLSDLSLIMHSLRMGGLGYWAVC